MKPRLSIQTKLLMCALANILLLATAVAVFVRIQFRAGLESILLAPAQARLRGMGDEISAALERAPSEEWPAILRRQEGTHGIELGLFLNDGTHLAGDIHDLPEQVRRQLEPPRPRPGGPEPNLPPMPGPRPGIHPVFSVMDGAPRTYWFGVRMGVPVAGQQRPWRGTLIVRAGSILFTPLLFEPGPWIGLALAIAAITLLCWIPVVRSLTGAVGRITAGAERIAEGRFDVKIAANRRDEMGQLAEALNRMAAQLSGFVHGQKRFLGDIAHELSAPIARTQVAVAILEERAADSQQRYVGVVRDGVTQMAGLVDELLHFSKEGLAAKQPAPSPVEVGELVQRVIEREEAAGLVRLTEGGDLRVLAQPDSLFRALSNLVRNAVRYAGADGPIRISARRENGEVLLTVADEGPGLPEDMLNRVFTPFYRPDTSRSRDSGGAGLGFAIVKTCVESSAGTVSCRNRDPRGLEVTIRLRDSNGVS